jgi:uncharacterized membrane protein YoaK (UPF0700 family)
VAKVPIALALAAAAGWTDTVAYLVFGHVFVAHMSGNTAAAAVHLQQGDWQGALHRGLPVPCFVLGTGGGFMLAEMVRKRGARRPLAAVLGLELSLLVAVLLASTPGWTPLFLLAAAMGVQSAALRHAAGHTVSTTFVTGMLVKMTDESVGAALARSRTQPEAPRSEAEPSCAAARAQRASGLLHLGLWLAFFGGGVTGAIAAPLFGHRAVVGPAVVVAIAALTDITARRDG